MSDLVAFLRARLDEDEAAAKAAGPEHICPEARGGTWQDVGDRAIRYDKGAGETMRSVDVKGTPVLWYEQIWVRGDPYGAVTRHIARHDPARVLREVAAKRAIMAEHEADDHWCARPPDRDWVIYEAGERVVKTYPCGTLRALAAVYCDHPDYRQEWKP